jgi:hypothetical protein
LFNNEGFETIIYPIIAGARRMDEGAKPSRLRRAPTDKHGISDVLQTRETAKVYSE